MRKLIDLKPIGLVIFSLVMVGCAQGPEDLQSNATLPQAVTVAQADTVAISPVAVVKAGYQTPATESPAAKTVIDNSACSIGFCPLPLRKPKAVAID
ncbi:MAG: hypothetical protein WAQ53_16075 [Thiofilum sp.]|uniref:hypothetical protein n=1 Tax=Thiofilum sp. TaxID=2212733 RepID=UPI0025F87BC2|nr:hypothetical protein [Thiofilum sp.]MBK8452367.1 hypothetical protein [Thiofilum sp.]